MKARHSSAKGTPKRRKQSFESEPARSSKAEPIKSQNVAAIQLFEPDSGAVYPLEQASQLSKVSRRKILIYCKERLVSPTADPDVEGYWFDGETLRKLRQIEELRAICDEPLAGLRLVLDLMREVQRLRTELNALEI